MESSEQSRFDDLYQRHLRRLKLQGKSDKTIDVYARAIRPAKRRWQSLPLDVRSIRPANSNSPASPCSHSSRGGTADL